jgi:hypothetical protein
LTKKLQILSKKKLQVAVVGVIVSLWSVSAIAAVFSDVGTDLLKVLTPIATLAFGWLYADHAINGGNG